MRFSLLCMILLAGVFLLCAPSKAQAGTVYGKSLVGYDQNFRYVYGYGQTWTDYETSFYYDPAVETLLSLEPYAGLDGGYDVGYSDPYNGYQIIAEYDTYSDLYISDATYSTLSLHKVVPYYTSGNLFFDPFNYFAYLFGDTYSDYYGLPGYDYDPYNYVFLDIFTPFYTYVPITTPSDSCSAGGGSQGYHIESTCSSPNPRVTIRRFKAVAKNGSKSVHIDVSPSSNTIPITLTLMTTGGSGQATFGNGSSSLVITQTTDVTIRGVTQSSTRDNILLRATANINGSDKSLAAQNFSVLWVDLSMRSGAGQQISGDNSARADWVAQFGTANLGPIHFVNFPAPGRFGYGIGMEYRGDVSPRNFDREITLRRTVTTKLYEGRYNVLTENRPLHEDTFARRAEDTDPRPNGRIYDLDAPGPSLPSTIYNGYEVRQRSNFTEFAAYLDVDETDSPTYHGAVVSDNLTTNARASIIKSGSDVVLDTDDSNKCFPDNVAELGWNYLTWNLCPEEPPQSPRILDDARTYVAWLYIDFLGRDPSAPDASQSDRDGWDFWTNPILQCGTDAACVDARRVDVARAFFYSQDFIALHPEVGGPRSTHDYNVAFVSLCYQTFLRRDPDAGGLAFWVADLDSKLPSPGDTDADYNHIIRAFLVSDEYRARFPTQ